MFVDHVDSKNAFLYSDVDADVYMKQSNGVEGDQQVDMDDQVCKLLKNIYGLKQGGT